MRHTTESTGEQALAIVEGLAEPNYPVNFQPTYPNKKLLIGAVEELLTTSPVTTPERVESLKDELAHIGLAQGYSSLEIAGSCHEEIYRLNSYQEVDLSSSRDSILHLRQVVRYKKPDALFIARACGQSVKPRSSEFETLPDGTVLPSFYGEGVNGSGYSQREPDPVRMVVMALQARDLSQSLDEATDSHIRTAHEVLLLPYEEAFIRVDEKSGKRYLLSADLPWIGVRTNDPDGPVVKMLSRVENPVGIKIGPDSDANHIRRLAQMLNPGDELGKLIFMLRVGNDATRLTEILGAIRKFAPNALVMYDIHAATKPNATGQKIRCVETVIDQAKLTKHLAKAAGVTFAGNHLETTTEDRYECVDTPDELPTHPGVIDPRLNTSQYERVLDEV